MSNVVTFPFKPDQKPAQAFASLNTQQESLADGIGSSYGVIGYKGKVWSLSYRGDRHIITRPDDGSPSSYIDAIVLRAATTKSKSYYKEGYDPNSSAGKRPDCNSINSIVPDADASSPQSTSCAICPRNVWKTNAEGRKTRECTDYKRLAVLLLPTVTKQLLGAPLMEPVFLRVPPASLNDLAVFGEAMNNQGWHYSTYVTRISFDPKEAHPKFVFRALQALSDAEAPVVLPLREDSMAKRIVGEDQANRPLSPPSGVTAAPPPATTTAPIQPAQQTSQAAQPQHTQQTAQSAQVSAPAAGPISTGLGLAPTVAAETTASSPSKQEVLAPEPKPPTPEPEPELANTGLLDLTANAAEVQGQPAAQAQPTVSTQSDLGESMDADDELDRRINSMLKVE